MTREAPVSGDRSPRRPGAGNAVDVRGLPKVELHCHLDGLVDPAMLQALRRQGVALPVTAEQLAAVTPIHNPAEWARWTAVTEPLEGRWAALQPILALHVERLKAQRVVYAELMIGGSEIAADRAQALAELTAFRAWLTRQEGGTIQVEFVVVFGRRRPPAVRLALADRLIALHEAGLVVGVGVGGEWATEYPLAAFAPVFDRCREAGLPIEVHAGERGGPETVWEAITRIQPDRLGHGVPLFADPALIALVKERHIHVELCPTSNVRLGSVPRIEAHPIGRARALGLSVSVNSDIPGPLGCSLTSEWELLARVFGFTADDFAWLRANALAARFQPTLRGPARMYAADPVPRSQVQQ